MRYLVVPFNPHTDVVVSTPRFFNHAFEVERFVQEELYANQLFEVYEFVNNEFERKMLTFAKID